MDRYLRVEKRKEETPINENEIRVTAQGRMRNYITYATNLLQEKGASEISLKAMGRAINKTVMIAEVIKRRIGDLHQITAISSTDITDTWEPLEEGLLPLETTRHVSLITITLSKKELDTSSTGYQPPIPRDQVKVANGYNYDGEGGRSRSTMGRVMRGGGRRGQGRGGNIANGGLGYSGEGSVEGGRGYAIRGRSFRGRGRSYVSRGAPLSTRRRGRGRSWGMVQGRGRGRGWSRGRGFRSNGPAPAAA